jgi:Na+/H+-dicarboxylate symporter
MLIYAFNFEMMGNWKYLMLSGLITMLILPILFFILACRDAKPNFEFFSFGNAFKAAFYTGIVFTVANLAFTLLFMNVIDPDFQDNLKQVVMDNMEEQFEGMSMDAEQVDEIMANTEKSFEDQKGIWGQTKGSVFGLIWFAIIASIVAATNKDKKDKLTTGVT